METMTYTFNHEKLAAIVKAVSGILPGKRCQKPILHNVKLRATAAGGVEAYATDLETSVIVSAGDCWGESIAETLVPSDTVKAIGKHKGAVSITPSGETMIETLGARVPVEDILEYPAAPAAIDDSFAAYLPFESIRRIDDHIRPATDSESSRYALGGILLERLEGERLVRAVGTDGRRLHALTIDDGGSDKGPLSAIVYPAAIRLFRKAVQSLSPKGGKAAVAFADGASVGIRVAGATVEFSWAADDCRVRVVTRVIEGRFPRWRDCFPADGFEPSPIMVPMPAGREQIQAAARFASESSKGVQFHDGTLSAVSADKGAYDAPFVGTIPNGVKVKLDPAFLLDMIDGAAHAGGVALYNAAADRPVLVRTGGGLEPTSRIGFAAVLMPLAAD